MGSPLEPEADARAHMGQTILVLDDEPTVRMFVVKVGRAWLRDVRGGGGKMQFAVIIPLMERFAAS